MDQGDVILDVFILSLFLLILHDEGGCFRDALT